MTTELSPRAREIRAVMHQFIRQRLDAKLETPAKQLEKNQESERKYLEALQRGEIAEDLLTVEKLREKRIELEQKISKYEEGYAPANWLKRAAKRASSIQMVTHPVKAVFPKAHIKNVSSLYVEPSSMPDTGYLTSHALAGDFERDVTGDAASLDVSAFLNEVYEGTSIGDLLRAGDADALKALDNNEVTAKAVGSSFREITEARTPRVASSNGVKQLFWLTGVEPKDNADYCVLAPMYPSHLSHSIFQRIQAHRFGDEAKKARAARRDKKAYEGELTEYPGLAVLKIGGANPQGISQLMSAQRGVNYLLSSLPPVWNAAKTRPLWGYSTLFVRFERMGETRHLIAQFEAFLLSDPPANVRTRRRVSRYVEQLIDMLVAFSRSYQELETAWTADERCKLPIEQRLWLNPYRAISDETFHAQWVQSSWLETLGKSFAQWLNGRLRERKFAVGDVEHRRWEEEFDVSNEWREIVESARLQRDEVEA